MKYSIFTFFLLFLFYAAVNAQEKDVIEEGVHYVLHTVKSGETLFSVCQTYHVGQEELIRANPDLKFGLKAGQQVRVPVAGNTYIMHKVSREETLYSISKQYRCSIDTIVKLNPDVKDGLWIGMKLKIPVAPAAKSSPVLTDNRDYFIYTVVGGETLWQLEQKYGVSGEELNLLNPKLKKGLKTGMKLKIPRKRFPAFPSDGRAVRYTVKRGETLFNISSRFNTSIGELQKLNPALNSRGLISGETILIPGTDKPENQVGDSMGDSRKDQQLQEEAVPAWHAQDFSSVYTQQEKEEYTPDQTAFGQVYQVGLLLPLYLPANDTVNRIRVTPEELMQDTTLSAEAIAELPTDSFRVRENAIVYPRSENFLDFYEGVLLAVDSLKNAGMHVDLYTFDTNNDPGVVDSLLHLPVFRELDLIIGPVFPGLQKPVADFAYRNKIPVVSPLSSSGELEESYPDYFKVNPTKKYLIRKTADYIARDYLDKNLVVLKMGEYRHLPEAELVSLVKNRFYAAKDNPGQEGGTFREYDYTEGGGLEGLKAVLSPVVENVFIIPSETEGQISVAVTNLNAVAEDYPVTLVGLSNFQKYKSIQTEYFHHENLNFLSPYFVDYQSKQVNQFLRKYRRTYFAEPNQFSFQGYDVAFYFMSALFNYGKEFARYLPSLKVDLMQGDFSFKKVGPDGGYLNGGLFILKYTPDYRIEMKGVTEK